MEYPDNMFPSMESLFSTFTGKVGNYIFSDFYHKKKIKKKKKEKKERRRYSMYY